MAYTRAVMNIKARVEAVVRLKIRGIIEEESKKAAEIVFMVNLIEDK